ncbi:topoisomerase [Lysinibacillus irui]|uniref:topoisomerase n=1 Tax=Lysinibacillus irui TaxID=2998077 RepID=UPI003D2BAAD8
MKKTIISGILFCSILLVGCSTTEILESEQEVVVSLDKLFADLQNEIILSITEQTELDSDLLAIMLSGGADEFAVSVGFPKDANIDGTSIQQIVEDSIENVSETETTSEEKIKMKIKIEKY